MPYLPDELPNARVLITVKTYPLPSRSYTELVCTAGLLNGEKWIRMYPIPYRFLQDQQKYPKYSWIELNLTRKKDDFRPESYTPKLGVDEPIKVFEQIGTANEWAVRKSFVLKETFFSMNELITLAKDKDQRKSLATLKPSRIVDFVIEEDEREWKQEWQDQLKQFNMFELPTQRGPKKVVKKLPYKFSYRFFSEGDKEPRKMMIEDWEIGALFWNCLYRTDGDEQAALELVKQKYLEEFAEKDLYLYVGTTLKFHAMSAPNPFVIIGVFYPPKTSQLTLFQNTHMTESENQDQSTVSSVDIDGDNNRVVSVGRDVFIHNYTFYDSEVFGRNVIKRESLKVFLCHSSFDKPIVRAIHKKLKNVRSIKCEPWLDEVDIVPGEDWDSVIKKAVKDSHVVLVCLSKSSITKEGYIQKEIKFALDVALEKTDETIFIIPIRLEECDVPEKLKKWQYIDYFDKKWFEKLITALEKRTKDLTK